MNFDLLVKRLEGHVTILLTCRQLSNYTLAMTTAGECQTVIVQVNQRLQTCIGGLNGIVEELRQPAQQDEPAKPTAVDMVGLIPYLNQEERADLGQLEHSFSELTIARDLVSRFKQRLVDLGLRRQQAGDVRGANL